MYKYELVKPGQVYHELTVLEEDFQKEEEYYSTHPKRTHVKFFKCMCSCGETATVGVYNLLSGKTRSCGHLQKENIKGKVKDLSGMVFGNLEVLYIDDTKPSGSGKHAYWICKCKLCGNTKSCRSSDLLDGRLTDCGCNKLKRMRDSLAKDLNGCVFGHLHVIERDYSKLKMGGGAHAYWICYCDLCGNIESVSSQMLTKYGKDRCKRCSYISMGERKIIEILEENNISFVHDKTYPGLVSPDVGGALRLDFRINENSDFDYAIEFDGEQHYKLVPQYDNSLSFERRRMRDEYKNKWCSDRGIPIIRIPYTHLSKLCIDDLKPDTSKYLVS